MTASDSRSDLPSHIGEALVEALALPDDAQSAAIERLCQEFPVQADQIWSVVAEHRQLEQRLVRAVAAAEEPQRIGPYRVLRPLGEGAFGNVYLAERTEPMRMRVAIKVIKPFLDTRTVLRRFDIERQALAVMQNDHIAKVLDAGTTEAGRPYFVMEYVAGVPITQYCDDQRLSVRDRLGVFCQVCAGVQHAHQKGVLHRDLKPSNILVTVQGGAPCVKIIDFGLARATDHLALGSSTHTDAGVLLGTPAYMSPEQAANAGMDLDTRTDIYSLGVLLYELLTGDVPLSAWMLRHVGVAEMQRILQEEEPLAPSLRVARSVADSPDIAKRRRTEPATLVRQLRGDLDWITLKALEKDRVRRYGTAEGLASDVERHVGNEPVEARPPSASYRLAKLLRRYRLQFVAATLVVLTSLAGAIVSTSFGLKAAERAEDYRRLLVGAQIDALLFRERKAHPAWPEQGTELAQLVEVAEGLLGELPYIESVLAKLEAGHVLPATAPRSTDRGEHPESGELARLIEQRGRIADQLGRLEETANTEGLALAQQRQRAVDEAIAGLRQRIEWSNRVLIADPRDRFLYDRLDYERSRLRRIARDLLPDLCHRRDWALGLRRRSIDELADSWRAAIERIRTNDLYGGLTIEPQIGLVPLGPDPTSRLEEFADLASGAPPERDQAGQLGLGPEHGVVLVLLPGSQVRFGFDTSVRGMARRATQTIAIAPFLLAKHELSRHQWVRLAGDLPGLRLFEDIGLEWRNLTAAELDKPANLVTWDQCTRLLERYGLELPAEAEWEYACKAGTETPWYTGDREEDLAAAANVYDISYMTRNGVLSETAPVFDDGFAGMAPIHAPLRPNRFGLLHMHGNVSEWCRDRQSTEGGNFKAIRGGAWDEAARFARSIRHNRAMPGNNTRGIGLRAARRVVRGA